MKQLCAAVVWGLCVLMGTAYAYELQISTPPLQGGASALDRLTRLTKLLEQASGIPTRFIEQESWLVYTQNVRLDIYDMLISEAHVASWAQRNGQAGGGLEHTVVMKSAVPRRLMLVTTDASMTSFRQLIGKQICVRPSPSMDAVLLYRLFTNPVTQPGITEYNESYNQLLTRLVERQCDAAVVELSDVPGYSELNVLERFERIPGPALSLSARLPNDVKDNIRQAMRQEGVRQLLNDIFNTISDTQHQVSPVEAGAEDYQGYDQLLEQVWGW